MTRGADTRYLGGNGKTTRKTKMSKMRWGELIDTELLLDEGTEG